ncbi:MAG TPA: hypothetical protein VI757_08080 [Bacteroidia bacterium]|nr:hypothetical protein [Bacteroidia bacterium]
MSRWNLSAFALVSCLLFFSSGVLAQRNTESKFYFGGNLGLMFGTYTVVDISPLIGYKVTERFHVGTGLTYTYYKYQEDGPNNTKGASYETSIYGGRLFTRYFVVENLFLHVEDELISIELPDLAHYYATGDIEITRQWLNSVLVGGGYGYGFGSDGPAISIMVLFRVNNEFDDFYPYQNPIIRVGLGFGF